MFSGHNLALVAAGCLIGLFGVYAALKLLPEPSLRGRGQAIGQFTIASVLLTATVWRLFLVILDVEFPHLGSDLPGAAITESCAFAVVGAAGALGILTFGSRSVRNMALAGSFLSSAVSCMVFVSMSGLAAPAVLAYDLSSVLAAMAGSSALCATGFWLFRRPVGVVASLASPALVAVSLVILCITSLSAILPFSDWAAASATPSSIAFRPVTAVFAGELAVTLVLGLMGAGVDHQAAGLVKRENERLRQLGESTFEALLIHRSGMVLDANARLCELLGRPLAAIRGRSVATLLPDADRPSAISQTTGKPEAREIEITLEGGELLPVEILSRDIPYAGGIARVTALRDIRERRAAEAQIRYLAQHDPLTGLLNRAQFGDIFARQLALAKRDGAPVAVFCIDLDGFKSVNDTLGHQAGDLLLKQVADRLLLAVRESDTVARIGGDEFILLQTVASQPDSADKLAQRLIEILSEKFDLGGHQACIGASIGIAIGLQDGGQPDELIRNADFALYRAKSSGRGTFCFFKLGMDAVLRERREMEQDIAKAIASGGFELAFQPLFGGSSANNIVGFEALLRWQTAGRGWIAPDE
ncbi:MAG: diguanylate cyclase, partial [Solirubrobacterales bacterium]|nr:diguanylate cyclase [Solirubrobacterales bacterium]